MKITIYVPALNSEKTIKHCLGSLISAGLKKNVLVIDGDSKDNTVSYARALGIKVLKKKSIHLANARNLAIKDCKTELIGFVDSDCAITKKWHSIIGLFEDKNVSGACGKLVEKYDYSLPDKWRAFHLRQSWGDKKTNPEFLFDSNCIFRLSALKHVGGYDERYKTNYEDVDISRRLKEKRHSIVYEPKAVCYHLKRDNLISVAEMARKWSFFSYPVPDTVLKLLLRVLVFNVHYLVKSIFRDLLGLKFNLIPVTVFVFLYMEMYDVMYFLRLK